MKDFQNLNKIHQKTYFVFLPLSLFILLVIFFFITYILEVSISSNKVLSVPFSVSKEAKFPIIKTEFVPIISAKGAIIMDADSKVVLYSKNPDLRFSSASTTKIMTALLALDYYKQTDILTVKQANVEGSALGLNIGQQMSFENLLYALLLPSANDAALTISQNYPEGEKAFVEKMNEKAKQLKLYNTHYSDAAGLIDKGDFTTPFDLARLASFASKNPVFKNIVATKEKIIYDEAGSNIYNLSNLNKLLGVNGVNGIKTGYTEEAGQVLVISKDEKGKTIIIVVMGSDDRFQDTSRLLDLVSNNLTYLSIHP